MKEVIVHPKPDIWTEIHDIPIPIPQNDEVVIKVAVAGSNVKGVAFPHMLLAALSWILHVLSPVLFS